MKKIVLTVLWVMFICAGLCAQQKYALVVGNGNYTGITKLSNPVNDANDMASALQGLGFTVDKVLNGNLDQMESAVQNLKRKLGASREAYGFFFYAGHGVQADGDNYLIPVEAANIMNNSHLRTRAVSLQFVLESLSEAGNELNMIVLDACRDNPFGWSRSGARGLSLVSAPSGSIIMYATSAGSTADDGTGKNGLFTGQLLSNLKTPGLSVQEVFNKTGADVLKVSGGKQHPELSLRYFSAASAYLGTRPAGGVVQPPPPPPVTPPANQTYKEGDTGPAGGIVFHDRGFVADGWRYLEAAPTDFTAQWGAYEKNVSGTNTAVGSGKKNTEIIVNRLKALGENYCAAQVCVGMDVNGFKDWFLPSKDELDLMYKNLKQKGLGNFGSGRYWSSSQTIDSGIAWGQNFSNGSQNFINKTQSHSVRAVRAF